jgi:hypothetical protein
VEELAVRRSDEKCTARVNGEIEVFTRLMVVVGGAARTLRNSHAFVRKAIGTQVRGYSCATMTLNSMKHYEPMIWIVFRHCIAVYQQAIGHPKH